MINRLIELSLRNRVVIVALYLAPGYGDGGRSRDAIDAIPICPTTVIVFTDWPGHSPQMWTSHYPLTTNLQDSPAFVSSDRSRRVRLLADLRCLRRQRRSVLRARARARADEPFSKARHPACCQRIGPDARDRHVFCVHGLAHAPLRDLRSYRLVHPYHLNAVPGVAEVASVGGFVQQYQIDVDPHRLRSYNLPLSAVVAAVRDSNLNVGGNVVESNGAWLIVRGVGLIQSIEDIRRIPIKATAGVPVYASRCANVHVGDALGVASLVRPERSGGGALSSLAQA